MTWFGRFRRRAALDRDLDRELQDHLERRTQALIAAGLTPAQARRQAAIESGGAEQVKEAVRDVRGTRWAHDFVQDVRYGARSLRKQPGPAGRGGAVDGPRHRRQHRDLLARRRACCCGRCRCERRRSSSSSTTTAAPTRSGRRCGAWRRALSPARWRGPRSGSTSRTAARRIRSSGSVVSGSFFETLGVQPALGRLLDRGRRSPRRRAGRPDAWRSATPSGSAASAAIPAVDRPHAGDRAACRSRSSASCRRASSARRSAAPSTSRSPIGTIDLVQPGRPAEPARRPLDVVAQRHVPPPARASRSTPRPRRCAACSRRSARRRCPPTGRPEMLAALPERAARAGAGGHRHVRAAAGTTASRCWC